MCVWYAFIHVYSPVVTMWTTCGNIKTLWILAYSVLVFYVEFSHGTVISRNYINWSDCIMDTGFVISLCVVWTEFVLCNWSKCKSGIRVNEQIIILQNVCSGGCNRFICNAVTVASYRQAVFIWKCVFCRCCVCFTRKIWKWYLPKFKSAFG